MQMFNYCNFLNANYHAVILTTVKEKNIVRFSVGIKRKQSEIKIKQDDIFLIYL